MLLQNFGAMPFVPCRALSWQMDCEVPGRKRPWFATSVAVARLTLGTTILSTLVAVGS
jgi:hypothetical protein